MTSETSPPPHTTRPASHRGHFAMTFTPTPRGARLARHLAEQRLDTWGIAYGSEAHDAVTLIVAELTANAVQHGHVPGCGFHLKLTVHSSPTGPGTVRTEVTDPRPGCSPAVTDPAGDCDTGRGLLLVQTLATRWYWHRSTDGPGKTVWAEYELPRMP